MKNVEGVKTLFKTGVKTGVFLAQKQGVKR